MVTGVPIVISCSSLVCSLEHFNLEISTRQCRKSPIDGILFCFEALCAQATFQFMSRSITRYHGKNGKRENSRSREREERGRDTQKEFIVPIFFFVGVVWRQHSHKITRDVDAIGDETHRVKEETSRDFSYPLIVLSNMIFCLSLSVSLSLFLWRRSRTYILFFQRWSLFDVELRQGFYICWFSLGFLFSFGIFFFSLFFFYFFELFIEPSHPSFESS